MTQPYASRVNTMAGVTTVTPLLQLAFLLLATCHCCFAIGDGLLRNGNFEHGPSAKDMKGTQVTGKYAIPQWEISGFVEYIRSGQKQGDMLLVVPEGAFAVRLGNEASIKQRLKVMKGMYYSITFSAARTCAQEERLNISVAPDSGVLPMQTMYSSNGWDSYAWAFRAELSYADIVIHNPGVEEDPACGPLIDAVAIRALYPPRPTNKSAIAQIARTIPGKTYTLSFSVGDASNACAGSMLVEAFAGKANLKVPYTSNGKGGFKRAVLRFVAASDRTRVMFYSSFYHMRNDDLSSLCGPVIDDVKLLSVRNPTTTTTRV
ncbi:Protein DUF642 L-GALACTONO-1,4-LACTONE-RESPONSIVE GENE 2 [Linum perenne]